MINQRNWASLQEQFLKAEPFNHIIIDNFWTEEVANALVKDYPAYDSPVWNAHYHNAIEDKKACNHWDKFPELTYKAFTYLNSKPFVDIIETITGHWDIHTDVGLHGGGWHCHHMGGKLNVHLDYSIHPKLKLERHYNLIVYMTPNWDSSWGGGLELWSHNEDGSAKECVQTVENKFNRAVLFDTTQYSWHGLPDDLRCPDGINRQSMAVYYLTNPAADADPRGKALFVPHKEQANDPAVLELIKQRSNVATAETVYKK
jgi:Rps23 Pro-64 3,4-dihydroxylase Tpa1-like proline 4-hydroxylase